ncbi:MAG: hypothetical protein KAI47_05730 [Deltaproteobacteria bacterium]|nr:hypothetical protein [Deltaproteobacteria bacterium]
MSSSPEDLPRAAKLGRTMGWGISLGLTAVALVWSFISILSVHCGFSRDEPVFRGHPISPRADNPKELRRCHRDVSGLVSSLHDEIFNVQTKALKFNTDPGVEWRNWSTAWRRRWAVVGRRCRLAELAGQDVNPIIDELYEVHEEVSHLQHAYDGVMARFIEPHARRLERLRSQLRVLRNTIEKAARKSHAERKHKLKPKY